MISYVKRVFSYVYPITRKVPSRYNGVLEVTYIDGDKVLNTSNTNYSFGSLHRVMQFALHRVDIKGNPHVLLLGLGGGSVIKIIRDELLWPNHIDAVDIDAKVIELANQEFGVKKYLNIGIHCQDAFDFVEDTRKKYGLIVIDLFIDLNTPQQFYEDSFWQALLKLAKKRCYIVFNTLRINNTTSNINTISKLLRDYGFEVFMYDKVEVSNMVLIAKRK